MGLKEILITQEGEDCFLVSNRASDPSPFFKCVVSPNIKGHYVVIKTGVGSVPLPEAVDLVEDLEKARELAYRTARDYAKERSPSGLEPSDQTRYNANRSE